MLERVSWYLIVVLICISLIIKNFISFYKYSIVCLYGILLPTHLLMYTWVVSIPLAAVNDAAVKIRAHVPVWVPAFNSFGKIPRSGFVGSYSNSMLNSFEKLPNCFPQHCTCTFLPAMHKGSNISISSPTLAISHIFFYYSHPNRCEMVSCDLINIYLSLSMQEDNSDSQI